jgi:hypothetical protein
MADGEPLNYQVHHVPIKQTCYYFLGCHNFNIMLSNISKFFIVVISSLGFIAFFLGIILGLLALSSWIKQFSPGYVFLLIALILLYTVVLIITSYLSHQLRCFKYKYTIHIVVTMILSICLCILICASFIAFTDIHVCITFITNIVNWLLFSLIVIFTISLYSVVVIVKMETYWDESNELTKSIIDGEYEPAIVL